MMETGQKIHLEGHKLTIKEKHHRFKFKCLKCPHCCIDANVTLSPYDILRLCERLNVNPGEFIQKYTFYEMDKSIRLPVVKLKTDNGCRFLDKETSLCTVYEDRPLNCRGFPVGRNSDGEKTRFFMFHCPGSGHGRKWTIEEWNKSSGTEPYEGPNNEWVRLRLETARSKIPKTNKFFTFFAKVMYEFDEDLIEKLRKEMKLKEPENMNEKIIVSRKIIEAAIKPYKSSLHSNKAGNT